MTPEERERRDAYSSRLAAGHAFTQSPATTNVCGTCGAHRDYHETDQTPSRAGVLDCCGHFTTDRHDVARCPDAITPAYHDGPLPCAHCAAPILWTDAGTSPPHNRYVHVTTGREACDGTETLPAGALFDGARYDAAPALFDPQTMTPHAHVRDVQTTKEL